MWKYRSSYVKLCIEIDLHFGNDWILCNNNAAPHKALSFKQFLAQKLITEMEHTCIHTSPALVPSDFWLFPKIKSALKGWRFQDTEDFQ
jgi:hypothetical protein